VASREQRTHLHATFYGIATLLTNAMIVEQRVPPTFELGAVVVFDVVLCIHPARTQRQPAVLDGIVALVAVVWVVRWFRWVVARADNIGDSGSASSHLALSARGLGALHVAAGRDLTVLASEARLALTVAT
jgi:hypothetical protein